MSKEGEDDDSMVAGTKADKMVRGKKADEKAWKKRCGHGKDGPS